MAKRKKPIQLQPGEIINLDSSVKIESIASESIALEVIYPTPREFEARPCSSCQAIRPHGKNYSRVYCTRGNIRYCKCHFCGHTWAQESR